MEYERALHGTAPYLHLKRRAGVGVVFDGEVHVSGYEVFVGVLC